MTSSFPTNANANSTMVPMCMYCLSCSWKTVQNTICSSQPFCVALMQFHKVVRAEVPSLHNTNDQDCVKLHGHNNTASGPSLRDK